MPRALAIGLVMTDLVNDTGPVNKLSQLTGCLLECSNVADQGKTTLVEIVRHAQTGWSVCPRLTLTGRWVSTDSWTAGIYSTVYSLL